MQGEVLQLGRGASPLPRGLQGAPRDRASVGSSEQRGIRQRPRGSLQVASKNLGGHRRDDDRAVRGSRLRLGPLEAGARANHLTVHRDRRSLRIPVLNAQSDQFAKPEVATERNIQRRPVMRREVVGDLHEVRQRHQRTCGRRHPPCLRDAGRVLSDETIRLRRREHTVEEAVGLAATGLSCA